MTGPNGVAAGPQREKPPPASDAAERWVLGALLLRCPLVVEVRKTLSSSDFRRDVHRVVYDAMLSLHDRGLSFDAITVAAELQARGITTVSLDRIIALSDDVATTQVWPEHVALVRDAAAQRLLHATLERLTLASRSDDASIAELLSRARDDLARVELRATRWNEKPRSQALEDVLRSEAFSRPQAVFSTGIAELDRLNAGGIRARTLTVLCGATGAGKSSLAIGIAGHLQQSVPVLLVSTELDNEEVAARVVAPLVGSTPADVLALRTDPESSAHAVRGWQVRALNLDAMSTPAPIVAIRDEAHAIHLATGQAPVIIVDYLQHVADMLAEDPDAPRMSVSRVANELRRLAQELDTAIIAVSSVSRAYYGLGKKQTGLEDEDDPRAWLAAAKESGGIEYACALFLYLDVSPIAGVMDEQPARIIVAKARHGRVGFVGMRFHGPSGRFTPDSTATEEMGPGKRATEAEAAVLATVAKYRDRPSNRTDLSNHCGARKADALAAIDRLLASGELTTSKVPYLNRDGAKRYREAIVLPDGEH